jgi:hypothetical protein
LAAVFCEMTWASCSAFNCGRNEKKLWRHGAQRTADSLNHLPNADVIPVTFSGVIR